MPKKSDKDDKEWLQVKVSREIKLRLKMESVRTGKSMGELTEEVLDKVLPKLANED
ncbi:hypothetical protein [Phormidesmis priestleyi]